MAALKITAEPGSEMHAKILALFKDQKKVKSGKLTHDEWAARARDLMAEHGQSLWR